MSGGIASYRAALASEEVWRRQKIARLRTAIHWALQQLGRPASEGEVGATLGATQTETYGPVAEQLTELVRQGLVERAQIPGTQGTGYRLNEAKRLLPQPQPQPQPIPQGEPPRVRRRRPS